MTARALAMLALAGGCWTSPTAPAAPASPSASRVQEIVVRDAPSPFQLVADDRTLYWIGGEDGDEGIWRADKARGARPVRLASTTDARGITLDGERVWWSDGTAVRWVPKAGGAVTDVLVDLPHEVEDLARDGDELVVASNELRRAAVELVRYSVAGQERSRHEVRGGVTILLAAREGLYVAGDFGLVRARRDGTTDELLELEAGIGAMVLDDDAVVFASGGEIYRLRRHGEDTPRSIAEVEAGQVSDVAVDATHVYWGQVGEEQHGAIVRVPKDGGPARVLARLAGGIPGSVLVDREHVYWTDTERGAIVRRRLDADSAR